jgi:hypothetical protein
LTEADARADGFNNLTELHRAMEELYPPEKRNGRELYKVTFRFPAD